MVRYFLDSVYNKRIYQTGNAVTALFEITGVFLRTILELTRFRKQINRFC